MNGSKLLTLAFFILSITSVAWSQVQVSGLVVDETEVSLPGVTVAVKGTVTGQVTDVDGRFTIGAKIGDVLEFRYLGMEDKDITLENLNNLKVVMKSNSKQLNEVVVIGYGSQKKSDVTGAISSLKREDFNQGVLTNPGQLLQGKMAGVNVTTTSGEPGAAQNIIIRGAGSLRSGTDPLYVVDGFLLDNSSQGFSTNPLNFINPSDIESIDVLKDASATAVYGSRASNGVVVITTKKGKLGKTEMNFSASTALSSVLNKIDVFSADEFRKQVVAIGGNLEDLGGNTNWQDELTQTGVSQELNFSIGGAASDKFSYYASAGYQGQEGILKNSNLKRYAGKLNMNQKAFNGRLNLDYNLTASHTENLRPDIGSTISDMIGLNPTIPALTNGKPTLLTTNALNPLQRYDLYSDLAVNNRILASISPSLRLFKGLVYKLNLGVDYSATNRDIQYKPFPKVINESNISMLIGSSVGRCRVNPTFPNCILC
jgi:iron complex outermembrane receptor protein